MFRFDHVFLFLLKQNTVILMLPIVLFLLSEITSFCIADLAKK